MFDRLEDDGKRAMNLAHQEAGRLGKKQLDAEHILLGLLGVPGCSAVRVLQAVGCDGQAIRARVGTLISANPGVDDGPMPFGRRSKKVLELAMCEAQALGDDYIGTEHLLIAYAQCVQLDSDRKFASVLGVDAQGLRSALPEVARGKNAPPSPKAQGSIAERLAHHVRALEQIKDDLVHEQRFEPAARLHELAMKVMSLANEISGPPS